MHFCSRIQGDWDHDGLRRRSIGDFSTDDCSQPWGHIRPRLGTGLKERQWTGRERGWREVDSLLLGTFQRILGLQSKDRESIGFLKLVCLEAVFFQDFALLEGFALLGNSALLEGWKPSSTNSSSNPKGPAGGAGCGMTTPGCKGSGTTTCGWGLGLSSLDGRALGLTTSAGWGSGAICLGSATGSGSAMGGGKGIGAPNAAG